jgi:hypothetical protein
VGNGGQSRPRIRQWEEDLSITIKTTVVPFGRLQLSIDQPAATEESDSRWEDTQLERTYVHPEDTLAPVPSYDEEPAVRYVAPALTIQ